MGKAEKKRESWQERRKKIKHTWAVPFVYVEWRCEQLSNVLEGWAFLDILGHVGRLGILVSIAAGVYVYVTEADERRMQAENQRKAKQYQAWQVINAAQGKPGGGGRKDALEDLHKDNVALTGVDISRAYLLHLNLEGANLGEANLSEAILGVANLSGANLRRANLSGANIVEANLSRATLTEANLSRATLTGANLSGAHLGEANLSGAFLWEANLSGAYLARADLSGAYLTGVNLTDIMEWQKIKSIEFANIYNVKNPPDGFIGWAKDHDAVRIEDKDEWKNFIRKKMEEKKKQEEGNS